MKIAEDRLQDKDPVAAGNVHLFLQSQRTIIAQLAAKKCPCVNAREEQWMRSVVQDFMSPLINSLNERIQKRPITDVGWKTVFDDIDKGAFKNVWKLIPFSTFRVHIPERFAIANAMADNHIRNDLRNSLTKNGYGNDPTWKCIGEIVDAAFRADMIPLLANAGDGAAVIWDEMNVAKMRDGMRDGVKIALGPGKEFIP